LLFQGKDYVETSPNHWYELQLFFEGLIFFERTRTTKFELLKIILKSQIFPTFASVPWIGLWNELNLYHQKGFNFVYLLTSKKMLQMLRHWEKWKVYTKNSKALWKADYSDFCIFPKFETWNIPYILRQNIFFFCKILVPT